MISDATVQAIVAGCVTLGLAWLGGRKLNAIAKTASLTHDLVNAASIVQLRLYSVSTRRIANLTHDGSDIKIANEAAKLLAEREAEQAKATGEHGSV